MEDLIFKACEFGALGGVTFYLLTKGTAALKELTDSNKSLSESNKSLAESVKALAEKVNTMDNHVHGLELKFEARLDRLEKATPSVAFKKEVDDLSAHLHRLDERTSKFEPHIESRVDSVEAKLASKKKAVDK